MHADDSELNPPEVVTLREEAALVDNHIKIETHGDSGDGLHYPNIIVADGQSGIFGSDIKIRVSYGMPLPPEQFPVEPAQISTTKADRANMRRELAEVAHEVEDLLRENYPLSVLEASELSRLGEDWPAVLDWRRSLEDDLRAKYLKDIRPRVIDTYERARVRGFFYPELEEPYTARQLIVIEKLPELLRRAANKP